MISENSKRMGATSLGQIDGYVRYIKKNTMMRERMKEIFKCDVFLGFFFIYMRLSHTY